MVLPGVVGGGVLGAGVLAAGAFDDVGGTACMQKRFLKSYLHALQSHHSSAGHALCLPKPLQTERNIDVGHARAALCTTENPHLAW